MLEKRHDSSTSSYAILVLESEVKYQDTLLQYIYAVQLPEIPNTVFIYIYIHIIDIPLPPLSGLSTKKMCILACNFGENFCAKLRPFFARNQNNI